MAILLIAWVCGSTLLCLALLGAAARPVPRPPDGQAAPGPETAMAPVRSVILKEIETALPGPAVTVHTPCHSA